MSTETLQFKTELKQILNIIIHSLYSHKDIFLRELISNASDALDKLRFEALTRHELRDGAGAPRIKVAADKSAKTLTISDTGIGMSRAELVENLGTVARSGTKAFLQALQSADAKDRPELIGQFGVGFYSAFMVADKVSVVSRAAGGAEAFRWESTGEGEFTVSEAQRAEPGTDVTLHLKADSEEFLEEWTLRSTIKKYSDFIEHPIYIDSEKTDEKDVKTVVEEVANSQKAIWLKKRSEVTDEEHAEFYKHLSHDFEAPAKTIFYSAEGNLEFKALLYVPGHRPADFMWADAKRGLHLYIRRVLIMDNCETLLPGYLRFVKGVVDAADLPLNVSREMLQQSPLLEKIKSNLTGKVLSSLAEMMEKELEAYTKFFKALGLVLKEGLSQDWTNREKLADLLLFESTRTEPGQYTSLAKYVAGMAEGQNEIWYIVGESRALIAQSPHLEALKAQNREVLLMTEPIDEFVVEALTEYKGKKLHAADKGAAALNVEEEKQTRFKPLLELVKNRLSEVKDVRLTARLKDSPVCLVSEEGQMGAHMERLMKRLGNQEGRENKRILELNADHPVVTAMEDIFKKDATDPRLENFARILYDQALIAEGSKIEDALAFAKRINELLVRDAGK